MGIVGAWWEHITAALSVKSSLWTLPSGSLSWILTAPTHDSLKISDDYSVLDGWIEKNTVDAADQASFKTKQRRYIN